MKTHTGQGWCCVAIVIACTGAACGGAIEGASPGHGGAPNLESVGGHGGAPSLESASGHGGALNTARGGSDQGLHASSAGQSSAEQSSAGQSSAGQSSAGQGLAGQGLAGQGSAGQSSAGQGSAGQGSAGQSSAGQGSAGQSSAGQASAGQAGAAGSTALIAQGALSLSVGRPTTKVELTECPEAGRTYELYEGQTAPSPVSPGSSLISGENGAQISCSVRNNGSTFAFSGSIAGLTVDSAHYPIEVTFTQGTVDADRTNGSVVVAVLTPVLASTFSSSGPCSVTVVNRQIKNGSLFAVFSCPAITSPPSGLCAVNQSVIVFENCEGT